MFDLSVFGRDINFDFDVNSCFVMFFLNTFFIIKVLNTQRSKTWVKNSRKTYLCLQVFIYLCIYFFFLKF